jgi:hypothetical protein
MTHKSFFTILACSVLLTGCRFSFEESDYVGHYEGTYRLASFNPSEGNAVLDITSAGNNKCNIMFCAEGQDSIFYYNYVVGRYSEGMYGVAAYIHPPGSTTNEAYVSKYDQHVVFYLNDPVNVNFSGDRIN